MTLNLLLEASESLRWASLPLHLTGSPRAQIPRKRLPEALLHNPDLHGVRSWQRSAGVELEWSRFTCLLSNCPTPHRNCSEPLSSVSSACQALSPHFLPLTLLIGYKFWSTLANNSDHFFLTEGNLRGNFIPLDILPWNSHFLKESFSPLKNIEPM